MTAQRRQKARLCEANQRLSSLRRSRAQTAVELAVFGSVLIFVIGTIVSAGLNRGNQQSSMLKATRMALTMSYRASDSLQVSSRNFATVLVVEDRLTAASSKFGAVDRVPQIFQGSGAHTANMFMPLDFGDDEDLPIMDVFVNGEHYTFTTAAFKTIDLIPPLDGSCTVGYDEVIVTDPTTGATSIVCNAHNYWEPQCIADTSATGVVTYYGCMKVYTIADNNPLIPGWCDNASVTCPPTCGMGLGCNLSPSDRFDLDRDGVSDVPSTQWERFAWQWRMIMAYDETQDEKAVIEQLYMDPYGTGPVILRGLTMAEGINVDARKNIEADFDHDLKLETITQDCSSGECIGGIHLWVDVDGSVTGTVGATTGAIDLVDVRDNQEGDMDLTHNQSDPGNPPGFTNTVRIYTWVQDSGPQGGTYMRIEDDGLYVGSGRITSTSMKHSIDIIEREFQLSNNTGRFCSGPVLETLAGRTIRNPVQVCGAGTCNSSANIYRTCLDTNSLILYMRSRVEDIRGRRWITDTSGDDYIDIQRPPNPATP